MNVNSEQAVTTSIPPACHPWNPPFRASSLRFKRLLANCRSQQQNSTICCFLHLSSHSFTGESLVFTPLSSC